MLLGAAITFKPFLVRTPQEAKEARRGEETQEIDEMKSATRLHRHNLRTTTPSGAGSVGRLLSARNKTTERKRACALSAVLRGSV